MDAPLSRSGGPPPVEEPPAIPVTNRLGLSMVDLLFGLLAGLMALGMPDVLVSRDGDLARHIAMGRRILHEGIFLHDTSSYTLPNGAVPTTEWLSRVVLAGAYGAGGLAAVAVLAALTLAAAYALAALFLRNRNVEALPAYGVVFAAAVLGMPHWMARPHMFTYPALALLLFLLEPDPTAGRRRAWLALPLFAVWANLHGGFLLGLVLLGTCLAGDVAEAVLAGRDAAPGGDEARGGDRAAWVARARYHGTVLALAVLGAMANPRGPLLLATVFRQLGDRWAIDNTLEFRSPDFHDVYGKIFLLVILAIMAGLTMTRRRLTVPRLLLMLLMLYGALFSVRNVPLFGLVVLPVLAGHFDPAWRSLRVPGLGRARRVLAGGEALARPGRWSAVAALPLLLLGLAHGRVGARQLVPATFDAGRFPVAAVQKARAAGLEGHLFNEFTWGGYLVLAWPEQRIFVDGMTDYFGAEIDREYLKIHDLGIGWEDALLRRDVALALLPPGIPLVRALERRGWATWYADSTAVLLTRDGRTDRQRAEPREGGVR